MLEFFAQYGPAIAGGIIGAGALAGAIYNIKKLFKLNKKVDAQSLSFDKQIEVTREGIVEAFKSAKLPNEIKLSITTKVDEVLSKARDTIIDEVKKNEAIRTTMMMLILKILSFTAASSKLTEDEKKQIEDMLKLIDVEDSTINL